MWCHLKFYKVGNKKGSVKKRATSNNRRRVFEIALEGGNGKVDGTGMMGEEMKLLIAKDLNLVREIFLIGEMSKFLAVR